MVQMLNGIAAYCSSDTFRTLIRWGLMLSVLVSVYIWTQKRDLRMLLNFFLIFLFVPTLLVGVKRSVQVIDVSNVSAVHKVDNVPLGIAGPIGLLTSIGYALARGYETVVTQPADAMQFSKTGLMFGSKIVSNSTGFEMLNPTAVAMFNDYVRSCVIPDINLVHKYSLQDLMNSADPYGKIFENPSPLRGIFIDGTFNTCAAAAGQLKTLLNTEVSTNGTTFSYYARKMFPHRTDAAPLFGQMLGDSYNYFIKSGSTASEIMRQNVTMNAIRNGLLAYGSANNAVAGMVTLSADMATQRQMIQNSTGAQIATQYLPLMHTIMLAILVGMFPFIVFLACINTMSMRVLKYYTLALTSLQLWPIAFAICNGAMVWFLKADSPAAITLSTVSRVQQLHAMAGSIAGWMMTSIPVICWALMSGIGGLMGNAASVFAASDTGAAAQSAGRVAEGNFAFSNMQMQNVQGYKWDTNRNYASGQNTEQLENGSTVMQTAGGGMVVNTAGGMSNLASHINFAKMQQSMAQQQLRNSEAETQSSLEGWRHDSSSTFQRMQSFAQRHGDNFSMGTDSRSGTSSQATQGAQQVMDAVQSYAKSKGISESDAYNTLERMGREGSLEGGVGFKLGGVGASANAKAYNGSDASVSKGGNLDSNSRESQDSRLARSFTEGFNMVRSASIDATAGSVESDGRDSLKQVQNSMQETDNHYQDYSRSQSRTKELSRMASMSDSESATVTSNLSQEFVAWMQEKNPAEARQLLTNTDSAETREQVAQYANAFVAERVKGRLDQHHQTAESGGKTGFGIDAQGASTAQPDSSRSAANSGIARSVHFATDGGESRAQGGGRARPDGVPVQSNTQQRFETEKNSLEKEGDDFRIRVMNEQRANQSAAKARSKEIDQEKQTITEKGEDIREDISKQTVSVEVDLASKKKEQKI
jgi:conjugal transfer mating pair stabilization protein TraG